jgi:multidrug resistance efflux pump
MNPASSAPDPSRSEQTPPLRSSIPPSTGSRRSWLIALSLLVVAAGGYFIGHSSGTASTGTVSSAQTGAGGFSGAPPGGTASGTSRTGTAGTGAAGTISTGSSGAIIAVQAVTARTGVLSTTRTATGTVATTQQTVVAAQASGSVSGLPVPVGGTVRAGQTVVNLSSTDLGTAVQSAQNALDTARVSLSTQSNQTTGSRAQLQAAASAAQITLLNAQSTLTAQQRLYGIGAISQIDLNTARAGVQQAQSTLSSAQAALSDNSRAGVETLASLRLAVQKAQISLTQAQQAAAKARITAPFAGQVTAISVSGGQYINAGTAAFTLTNPQRQVSFTVPPSQSAPLKTGQLLTYTVGQQKYTLKVTENAGAPVNGNVQLVARFVDAANVPPLGTVGSVAYPYTVAQGVLVPSTALQLDGDTTSVFTVSGGQAKQVTVTVAGQAGTQAAVNGLSSGASVIGQPPSGLLDGARVTTSSSGARAGSSGTASSSFSGTTGTGTSRTGTSGTGTSGTGTGAGSGQTTAPATTPSTPPPAGGQP